MQVSRLLIGCAQANGGKLTDSWDMVLAVLQHLVWILGMKPTSAGNFRIGGDTTTDSTANSTGSTSASTTVLTTAISSELPDLVCFFVGIRKYFAGTKGNYESRFQINNIISFWLGKYLFCCNFSDM